MAKLLTLLFEITALFDMRTRTELVMLQKTMVVVEGVARTLDPRLDMWSTSEPVVRSWIESNLGPAGIAADVGSSLEALGRGVAALPDVLIRAEQIVQSLERAADDDGPLSPTAVQTQIGHLRLVAIALWVIAIGVVYRVVFG